MIRHISGASGLCCTPLTTSVLGCLQVWECVRGGQLDPAAANNMLVYAADVTGSKHLDLAAFEQLIAHLS